MTNKKDEDDKENILIEEILPDDNLQDKPNFILGDRRKEIFVSEILLFAKDIKTLMQKKDIEVTIKIS